MFSNYPPFFPPKDFSIIFASDNTKNVSKPANVKKVRLMFLKKSFSLLNKLNCNSIMSEIKKLKIATHDGIFHCDEVLACYMLQQLPKYSSAEIIRTRKPELIDTCDIVVDVGSVFDVEKNRFDHHQKSFQSTLSILRPELGDKWNIRLSSAGLIYTYFGEEVIRTLLKRERNYDITDEALKSVYQKVYEYFIREIDAIDNGVQMYEGEGLYFINTHLSARVGRLNSQWNDDSDFDSKGQFAKAQKLVGTELFEEIVYYTFVWLPARSIVQKSIEDRFNFHSSGNILVLEKLCPWKQHFFELEGEMNLEKTITYVIYQSGDNDWRIGCVPVQPSSFLCRKFLHKDWRGIRDEDLAKASGISESNFCHANGFIGGAKTKEAALKMAVLSLEGEYTD